MSKAPQSIPALDKIALVVLNYRPKPKSKAARKRVRKAKQKQT
jgi:hypothetical protein